MHNQRFYKTLQAQVIAPLGSHHKDKIWADIGCSTGLLTRLAHQKGYRVNGYDINNFSLFIAKCLYWHKKEVVYKNEDFFQLSTKFDVVSATSLLSVIDNKKETLNTLINLLKDAQSTLIIIEPTAQLSSKNVRKLITNIKSFWFYKGLLLWAKARENKAIDDHIFENLTKVKIKEKSYLNEMICVRYITLL